MRSLWIVHIHFVPVQHVFLQLRLESLVSLGRTCQAVIKNSNLQGATGIEANLESSELESVNLTGVSPKRNGTESDSPRRNESECRGAVEPLFLHSFGAVEEPANAHCFLFSFLKLQRFSIYVELWRLRILIARGVGINSHGEHYTEEVLCCIAERPVFERFTICMIIYPARLHSCQVQI